MSASRIDELPRCVAVLCNQAIGLLTISPVSVEPGEQRHFACSSIVLISRGWHRRTMAGVYTPGEAHRLGWQPRARCAFGKGDGPKSIRKCFASSTST